MAGTKRKGKEKMSDSHVNMAAPKPLLISSSYSHPPTPTLPRLPPRKRVDQKVSRPDDVDGSRLTREEGGNRDEEFRRHLEFMLQRIRIILMKHMWKAGAGA